MEEGHDAVQCVERFAPPSSFTKHSDIKNSSGVVESVCVRLNISLTCRHRRTNRSALRGCQHERVGADGLHVQQRAAECR